MSILKGIPFLRQELTKIFMKRAADKSGIMRIPFKNKDLQLDIEDRVQKYIRDAEKQGVDLDMVSNENLKYTINLNENVDPISRAISADSPEGRKITEALLGKRNNVVDMTGKKIDTSQGIVGGKSMKELMESGQVTKGTEGIKKSKKVKDREMFQKANEKFNETDNFVTNTITKIKSMNPMDAMKEANLVIGRKNQYKNLTLKQSQKILKDTDDHIFERNISVDPEDMADGGVAGLLGERTGYANGNGVADEDAEKAALGKRVRDLMDDGYDFGEAVKKAMEEGYADGGRIGFKGGGADAGGKSSPGGGTFGGGRGGGNARENYRTQQYKKSKTKTKPGGGGGKTTTTTTTTTTPKTNPRGFPTTRTLQPGLFERINTHFVNNQKLKDAVARGDITQEDYNVLGGFDAKQTLNFGPVTTGITSAAYNTVQSILGDQPFFDGASDVGRNVFGSTLDPNSAYAQQYNKIMNLADGGPARQNFKMGRRAFLKLMGGIGAGIGAAKAGLGSLFKAGKPITKAAKIVTPAAKGKPEWFDALVTRVINEGDDVTKKFATKDREIVHTTKIDDDATVTVYRDLNTDNVRVDIDDATKNVMDDQGNATVSLEVRSGKSLADETTGKTTPGNEFEAVETDYRNYMDGPDDFVTENVENVVNDTKNLTADLTKVKLFAKGQKKPTIKEIMIQRDRAKTLKQAEDTPAEYAADRGPDYDPSDYATGGRVSRSGGGIMKLLKLLKPKPKKLETVKDFISKRQFLKSMVGNTEKNKKARELKMLKEAVDEARKKGGFKFPSKEQIKIDLEKKIQPILNKGRKLNATGGLANMLGE